MRSSVYLSGPVRLSLLRYVLYRHIDSHSSSTHYQLFDGSHLHHIHRQLFDSSCLFHVHYRPIEKCSPLVNSKTVSLVRVLLASLDPCMKYKISSTATLSLDTSDILNVHTSVILYHSILNKKTIYPICYVIGSRSTKTVAYNRFSYVEQSLSAHSMSCVYLVDYSRWSVVSTYEILITGKKVSKIRIASTKAMRAHIP